MMTDDELRALLAKSREAETWMCAGCDKRFHIMADCRKLLDVFLCLPCYDRATGIRRASPSGT